MNDIILYHGSRGGIEGKIKPISRPRCDFGKGFYMGTNPEQVQGLVAEDAEPYFYTLKLKLSEIPENKILNLYDKEWIYTILANRKKINDFNCTEFASKWLKMLDNYDVIIGAIADDRMNEAMQRFTNYGLTDEGLIACLKSVDYGNQYVAKTNYACSKIEIISERMIMDNEIDNIAAYSFKKKQESRNVIEKMSIAYQRKGLYLNEFIDNLKNKPILYNNHAEEEEDYDRY